MTMGKFIKNAIVTFVLATILFILFFEEFYNKPKIFPIKIKHSITFLKLLINHHQTSPHQQHPKTVQ